MVLEMIRFKGRRKISFSLVLFFIFSLLLQESTMIASERAPISNQFISILHALKPFRGQLGEVSALKTLESQEVVLEAILKTHTKDIGSNQELLDQLLEVGAAFCDLDPTNVSIEFLLDFQKLKGFLPALKKLPVADRHCLQEALILMSSPST